MQQEEEAKDFVEEQLRYEEEGGLGCVWSPSYEDYTMRTGITCHRWSQGYSRKLQRGEFSVQEKMEPGQVDKEDQKGGQKRKGGQDRRSNLNIPNPDRREMSTFSSDKISPVLRPETKEISRGETISIMLPWKDISLHRTGFSDYFILIEQRFFHAILHQV